jgi:hypothetical protein
MAHKVKRDTVEPVTEQSNSVAAPNPPQVAGDARKFRANIAFVNCVLNVNQMHVTTGPEEVE